MVWIKRNLFFVIGGVVALGLLGAAGFYDFQSWSKNAAALDKLNEICSTLKDLAGQKPSPGNDKVNNIEAAKQQESQMRDWIRQSVKYFQPIAPIPEAGTDGVSSEAFAAALRKTVDQLQREALANNIMLPPEYDFSFAAERPLVKFAPGSLDQLPVQLGEVKAIAEIIYAAHVNSLDGIQRARVSDDDSAGSQADYIDEHSVTNDLAVITPYVVTFRAFSSEIAQVLKGFAAAGNGFIIKGVNVQPAGSASAGAPPPGMQPGFEMLAPLPSAQVPSPNKGALPTVLKEQLLRVTIEVEIVKLLPKK